ncbi:MAG: hypothetical protein JWN14_769 [Chthonomonadales bacterium]|nr:hypothetical protein [Chthonomonadales bacterium]
MLAATLGATDAISKTLLFVKQIVSETEGIAPNARITVDADYSGVIVHEGAALYVLPAGDHVIGEEAFPLLVRKAPGTVFDKLDAGVYLVRTRQVDIVEWNTKSLFRDSERPETSDRPIQGRSWLRIDSPARFLLGVLRAMESDPAAQPESSDEWDTSDQSKQEQQSPTGAPINLQAHRLVMQRIEAAASETMQKGSFLTEDGKIALDPLQAALKPELQRKMADIGMDCTALRISILFVAQTKESFHCVKCGSSTRSTLEVEFTLTTSFFFSVKTETWHGYFCTPCASSVAWMYNLRMLGFGWWRLIGLFMTPVLIVINFTCAIMVMFTAKTPEQHEALSLEKMKRIAAKGK